MTSKDYLSQFKTKVAGRGWTYWYELPFIQYGEVDTPAPTNTDDAVTHDYGTRLLLYKKGHAMLRGDDVLAVQARLTELGFDPGKTDGVYGPKSTAAVTAFQAAAGIEDDGIVGPVTRGRLAQ